MVFETPLGLTYIFYEQWKEQINGPFFCTRHSPPPRSLASRGSAALRGSCVTRDMTLCVLQIPGITIFFERPARRTSATKRKSNRLVRVKVISSPHIGFQLGAAAPNGPDPCIGLLFALMHKHEAGSWSIVE